MTGTTGNVVQDRGSAQMCRQMIRNLLLVLSGPSHTHTILLSINAVKSQQESFVRLLCNRLNIALAGLLS